MGVIDASLTNSDIENLATSIEQIQNVQGDINNYQSEVSDVFNNTTSTDSIKGLFDGLFN